MSNSDQLKMHSPNLVDSNIEKIAALFPNCITETKDENGKKPKIAAIILGKKTSGIKLPDIKATKEFFNKFDPQRFLKTNAVKPKQILK